jgi:hypothetical protein
MWKANEVRRVAGVSEKELRNGRRDPLLGRGHRGLSLILSRQHLRSDSSPIPVFSIVAGSLAQPKKNELP